jgi:hypothetical protein
MVDCYHGCPHSVISTLVAGKINVSLGSGELGKGFYSSFNLWTAKIWALRNYQSKTVLKIEVEDENFFDLAIRFLSEEKAIEYRKYIKRYQKTKSYLFGEDVVWSPIVGDQMRDKKEEQLKWESKKAECLLNSQVVRRTQV